MAICPGVSGEPCRGAQGSPARISAGGVCGHCARRQSAPEGRKAAQAAKTAASPSSDSEPQPWTDRPVPLSEVREFLNATGSAGSSDLHKVTLVGITQGPDGMKIVSVATMGTSGDRSTGALEVTDPFASSEEMRHAEVHSRTLREALDAHSKDEQGSLSMSDIAIDENGLVTVGETDVVAPDGSTRTGRVAEELLKHSAKQAALAGIEWEQSVDQFRQQCADEVHGGTDEGIAELFCQQAELCPPLDGTPPGSQPSWMIKEFEAKRAQWNHQNPHVQGCAQGIPSYSVFHIYNSYDEATAGMDSDNKPSFADWLRSPDRDSAYASHAAESFASHMKRSVQDRGKTAGVADYERRYSEWAAEHGYSLEDMRAASQSEKRRKSAWRAYLSDRQRNDLNDARKLLASVGDPQWDSHVTAAEFNDEVALVASASATSRYGRDILREVHFGEVLGRHRMTATDAYRLHSSARAIPAGIKAAECALPSSDLATWRRSLKTHLRDTPNASIGVGRSGEDAPVKEAVALCAGQIRMVSRSASGASQFPCYENFIRAASEPASVTIAPSDLPKLRSKSKIGGAPIHFSLSTADGNVTSLGWAMRDDNARWTQGSAPDRSESHTHTAPDIPFGSARNGFVGDAIRFASPAGGNVEMRNLNITKPITFVPAGSPSKAEDADRISLVTPYRA